jgi:hypothetical protein
VVQPTARSRSSISSTPPRPVPKPALNTSTSTLSSSYTYLGAPGSFPSKAQDMQVPQNGWTIVRKSRSDSIGERREQDGIGDVDVEGDMIIGDLEQDGGDPVANTKLKQNQGCLRDDVDEIINGTFRVSHAVFTYPSSRT